MVRCLPLRRSNKAYFRLHIATISLSLLATFPIPGQARATNLEPGETFLMFYCHTPNSRAKMERKYPTKPIWRKVTSSFTVHDGSSRGVGSYPCKVGRFKGYEAQMGWNPKSSGSHTVRIRRKIGTGQWQTVQTKTFSVATPTQTTTIATTPSSTTTPRSPWTFVGENRWLSGLEKFKLEATGLQSGTGLYRVSATSEWSIIYRRFVGYGSAGSSSIYLRSEWSESDSRYTISGSIGSSQISVVSAWSATKRGFTISGSIGQKQVGLQMTNQLSPSGYQMSGTIGGETVYLQIVRDSVAGLYRIDGSAPPEVSAILLGSPDYMRVG